MINRPFRIEEKKQYGRFYSLKMVNIVFTFAATEEDGGPNPKVPDSEQSNLCRVEQVFKI